MNVLRLMFTLPILGVFHANAFEKNNVDVIFDITEVENSHLLTSLIGKEEVNQRDILGDTPLLASARVGDIHTMSLLLKHGADINVLDAKKRDILNIAISTSNVEMAKWALANGIDPTLRTSVYQGSALIYASHQGAVDIVNLLVTAGAPLNRKNNIGWTALLEATVLGDGSKPYQDIVKILVKAGADISIADRNGITPLQHAENRGHSEIASILRSAL